MTDIAQAREHVAQQMEAQGERSLAATFRKGLLDKAPEPLAVLAAIKAERARCADLAELYGPIGSDVAGHIREEPDAEA